ncbi:putative oxidoreductase [Porphyridium purpureum]|uniref:Putative oxidoreductase n=1 Tax=Porphyridium purpureum TaxID=35688 RepID=A0A5J4YLS2_PORPP|nr:putative oxidoreductase [Porphyridium purpureum]|eukprot:POR3760..scf246_12
MPSVAQPPLSLSPWSAATTQERHACGAVNVRHKADAMNRTCSDAVRSAWQTDQHVPLTQMRGALTFVPGAAYVGALCAERVSNRVGYGKAQVSVTSEWRRGRTERHRPASLAQKAQLSTGRALRASAATMASGGKQEEIEYDVVILGAGIIGAATAYYLSRQVEGVDTPRVRVLVIEREAVACSSSGKAGGFLARTWGDGGDTQQLHRVSFALHEQLAAELQLTSYRKVNTLQAQPFRKGANASSWLSGDACRSSLMDDTTNTAQVTPFELTARLMQEAQAAGVELVHETACGFELHRPSGPHDEAGSRREVASVRTQSGKVFRCRKVLIAMGVWSTTVAAWLDAGAKGRAQLQLPLEGILSTSLVFERKQKVLDEPFAVFCGEDRNGCHLELYPRANGDLYVCGMGGSEILDIHRVVPGGDIEAPSRVRPSASRLDAAMNTLRAIAPGLVGEDGGPDIVQACIRPCAPDAKPLMGRLGRSNAFIATGHNCWGILWGPASGKAMAELLLTGKSATLDLSPFEPTRFMPQKLRRSRQNAATGEEVGEFW